MKFKQWLETFIGESGLDMDEEFQILGPSGVNYFTYKVIKEFMLIASKKEQESIKNTIVMIDFKNGDVLHFFRHLAKAVVK